MIWFHVLYTTATGYSRCLYFTQFVVADIWIYITYFVYVLSLAFFVFFYPFFLAFLYFLLLSLPLVICKCSITILMSFCN